MRYISTGDAATDHNLRRLDHLASLNRFDPDPESMHNWLVAVINSLEALPRKASKHFQSSYYLGDTHYRMSPASRIARWQKLVEELRREVDAVYDDPGLRRDGPEGPPDLSDRRQTKGERILALCDRLDKAGWGTPEFDNILNTIGTEAAGGIGADVAELKRLSKRKRIPDLEQHRYWILRHISRIRSIAEQLHHLP